VVLVVTPAAPPDATLDPPEPPVAPPDVGLVLSDEEQAKRNAIADRDQRFIESLAVSG
jgi:hypothetical protein